MTGRDLKMARGKLVGTGRGAVKTMAARLDTPYRTYQGWEASKGMIPGVAGVAVESLIKLAEIDQAVDEMEAEEAEESKEV